MSVRDGSDIQVQTPGRADKDGRDYDVRMERSDRWGVVLVACAILGFIAAGVTAKVVRFAKGGYDMQGMWTIVAVGSLAWIVSSAVAAGLWLNARRRDRT
jgi:hypothetical protein